MLRGSSFSGARRRRSFFGRLTVATKISAFSVGVPLFVMGLVLMMSDLAETLRLHSVLAAPQGDLAIGAAFAVVGLSFLWPMRRGHHRG